MTNGVRKAAGSTRAGSAGGDATDGEIDSKFGLTSEKEGEPRIYKKKKSGRRYSKNTEDFQRIAEGANRAVERLASGVEKGLRKYRQKSDKSADKKKDGMFKDLPRNLSDGFSEAASTAARAPADLTKKLTTKRARKLLVPRLPGLPF